MIDDKKLYYGTEAKEVLIHEVNRIAIENQKEPHLVFISKDDAQSVLIKNTMIAAYNRGIMKMRDELIKQLGPQSNDEEATSNDDG